MEALDLSACSECLSFTGTGWPSFYEALPGAVDETIDNSIPFMARTGETEAEVVVGCRPF